MLSKAQIKHITALRTKKYRSEHSQFFVEGKKSIQELLKSSFEVLELYHTSEIEVFAQKLDFPAKKLISNIEYGKISNQKQPEGISALVNIPEKKQFNLESKKVIALDKIRDPGNMGTIIRIADWFGVEAIICSQDCVELYNPKVIQASMGSIFHVKVHYLDLEKTLKSIASPKLAATLDGVSIYERPQTEKCVLVLGNEANGISENVLAICTEQITIPPNGQAESLNAAMACGILSSYLFR